MNLQTVWHSKKRAGAFADSSGLYSTCCAGVRGCEIVGLRVACSYMRENMRTRKAAACCSSRTLRWLSLRAGEARGGLCVLLREAWSKYSAGEFEVHF